MDFAVTANHRLRLKESEKKDKYLDIARKFLKTVGYKSDDYTDCNWCSWYSYQRIDTKTGGPGNNRTSRDYPSQRIIKIGQNTEKSSGDLIGLAVTQTPIENHLLSLM